jgi:hypothetical protein
MALLMLHWGPATARRPDIGDNTMLFPDFLIQNLEFPRK